eukprot:2734544-Alexandrium_andersonii.AAC.1
MACLCARMLSSACVFTRAPLTRLCRKHRLAAKYWKTKATALQAELAAMKRQRARDEYARPRSKKFRNRPVHR